MSFKNAIALTGGIATGKSSTCSLLLLHGFKIIDADKIAHKILEDKRKDISDLFGEEYIKDGKVNRKKLGSLIFSNKSKKEQLEKLLHPAIQKKIKEESIICENQNIPYIIDIPLFYENRSYDIDEVVLVYTTKDIQLQRLINRENFTKEEAYNRINAQIDIEKKRKFATFIIDNTKDLKHLQHEVDRFISYIKKRYKNLNI